MASNVLRTSSPRRRFVLFVGSARDAIYALGRKSIHGGRGHIPPTPGEPSRLGKPANQASDPRLCLLRPQHTTEWVSCSSSGSQYHRVLVMFPRFPVSVALVEPHESLSVGSPAFGGKHTEYPRVWRWSWPHPLRSFTRTTAQRCSTGPGAAGVAGPVHLWPGWRVGGAGDIHRMIMSFGSRWQRVKPGANTLRTLSP